MCIPSDLAIALKFFILAALGGSIGSLLAFVPVVKGSIAIEVSDFFGTRKNSQVHLLSDGV